MLQLNRIIQIAVLIFLASHQYFDASGQTECYPLLVDSKSDSASSNLCFTHARKYVKSDSDSALIWLKWSAHFARKCKAEHTYYSYLLGRAQVEMAHIYFHEKAKPGASKAYIDSARAELDEVLRNDVPPELITRSNRLLASTFFLEGVIERDSGNATKSKGCFNTALHYASSVNDSTTQGLILKELGEAEFNEMNYPSALNYFRQGLDIFQRLNDKSNIARFHSAIGALNFKVGAIEKSLSNHFAALSIYEDISEQLGIISSHISIGDVLLSSSNHGESIRHFRRALSISANHNERLMMAKCYYGIGIALKELRSDSAGFYLSKARELFSQENSIADQVNAELLISQIFLGNNQFGPSGRMLSSALALAKSARLTQEEAMSYLGLAHLYLQNDSLSMALEMASRALEVSTMHKHTHCIKDSYRVISDILYGMGEYRESNDYFELFFAIHDSINRVDLQRKFSELESVYQLEQNRIEISKLRGDRELKDSMLKNAELQILWNKTHSFINLAVLAFMLIIMLLLYRQFVQKRRSNAMLREQNAEILQKNEEILAQKEEIEAQRNELERQKELLREKSEQLERFNWMITDSIDYASSIQGALLPSKETFADYFDDHFVIYFPKDVVSGDFYWAYTLNDTIIVALADCTGHGVPGGFMSMMGISALTELMGRGVMEPSDILNSLRLLVIQSLKQTGKIGEHQEGMDISVFSYTRGSDHITFAGANHPLWVISKAEAGYAFKEFKGDRMPISYTIRMNLFASQKIPIKKGDQLYLLTDGLNHQLGDENFSCKFGKQRTKTILLNCAGQSMDEQKNILEDAFFRWVNGFDQLDDITLIGFKI